MNNPPIIFKHFPELAGKIAWISLGSFPTPVHKLTKLGYDNLWIKRDDRSSNIYGGSKVRKLEFILADVKAKNKKLVVTFGGTGTNHGLATTIFGRKLRLSTILVLYDQPLNSHVEQNQNLFRQYGAKVFQKGTLLNTILSYFIWFRLTHPQAYFLYAGGSTPLGTVGLVNAAFELKAQVDAGLLPQPKTIFCAAGSNGILAGLSLGVKLAGIKTTVVGVRVTPSHFGPFPTCTAETAHRLAVKTYRLLIKHSSTIPQVFVEKPVILSEYFGAGYGFPTKAGCQAHQLLKSKEGIFLEPTYTAKTFAAVIDYCVNRVDKSEPVLYWHTCNYEK